MATAKPQTARIQARIDAELKANVDAILDDMGMTASQAIKMFYRQIEALKALPFQPRRYNEETEQAIADVKARRNLTSMTLDEYKEMVSDLQKEVEEEIANESDTGFID